MKLLLIFSLALATATAFDLRGAAVQKEGRITNADDASVGQFPYQVGIMLPINSYNGEWCGGSLIAREWILTAAHCLERHTFAIVYLGTTNYMKPDATFKVSSNNFIVHTNFNSENFENDIALIRIPAVSLNSRIDIIKLPAVASASYSTFADDYVITSGWGRISDKEVMVTQDLQWARFKVISNSECRQYYRTLTASSMCIATANSVSTCDGDSGGPLVLESSGILIGITSFGYTGGCEKGYPTGFTRVTNYLDWINFHTGIAY